MGATLRVCFPRGAMLPLVAALALAAATAQPEKPHILLITTDQQRVDSVGAYGLPGPPNVSPRLDALRAEGVLWTRAYAAAPSCSPCRTSLLTGVHVPVHGVIENGWVRYRPGLLVYPDLLKKAGYDCSVYGKTHFKPEPPSLDVVVPVNAKTKQKGHCNALDMRRGGGGECRIEEKDFLETVLVDAFVKKLKTARRDGPWFAHVSLLAPHPVSLPPKGWGNKFTVADLPAVDHRPGDFARLPEETKLLLHNTSTRTYKHPYVKATDGSLIRRVVDAERVAYYSFCAYVDAQVGRAVAAVDAAGLRDRTLVLFTSDHGSQLFDHGVQNSKHTFLEASWRVPLLARWPGVLPAGGEATFASTVDLTATILAAAGAGVPRSMAGYDLVAPFRGAGAGRTRAAAVAGALYRGFAVVTARYKLVYFPERDEGRFYDLEHDPTERNDLWRDAAHAARRAALHVALLRWRVRQDDLGYEASILADTPGGASKAAVDGVRGLDANRGERDLQTAAAAVDAMDA